RVGWACASSLMILLDGRSAPRGPPAVGDLPARESLAGPCPASFAPPVSVSSAAVVCSSPCPSCHPCLPCLLLFSHHDSSRRVNVNLTGMIDERAAAIRRNERCL